MVKYSQQMETILQLHTIQHKESAMYVDIHTDHGKHFHFELPHVAENLKSFAKRMLLTKKITKPTIEVHPSQNFHADQTFKSRHSRTYIGYM